MVPKSFRAYLEALGESSVYVTFALGQPRRLEVRSASSFLAYQAWFTTVKKNAQLERFGIFYFGSAEPVDIDNAGRIRLPAGLRREVSLTDKAVFVGVDGERFQVWRPEDLGDIYSYCDEHADDIQDSLSRLGAPLP